MKDFRHEQMLFTVVNMLWIIQEIIEIPRKIILFLIRVYQKTLSPDHGWFRAWFPYGYCKFTPSCSEYGYQSIEKYRLLRGVGLAVWRILRCNPWSHGGIDEVK